MSQRFSKPSPHDVNVGIANSVAEINGHRLEPNTNKQQCSPSVPIAQVQRTSAPHEEFGEGTSLDGSGQGTYFDESNAWHRIDSGDLDLIPPDNDRALTLLSAMMLISLAMLFWASAYMTSG